MKQFFHGPALDNPGGRTESRGMILAKVSQRPMERVVALELVRREKGKNPYKVTRREIEASLRRLIKAARR